MAEYATADLLSASSATVRLKEKQDCRVTVRFDKNSQNAALKTDYRLTVRLESSSHTSKIVRLQSSS